MARYLLYIVCMFAAATAAAQKYPERSLVRKGNRAFAKERYEKSIERYGEALRLAPGNFEAAYDLGNALALAERYDKAGEMLRAAAADSLRSPEDRAEAWFNLGNTQLAQQKLQEALESYRNSLRMNPADTAAKYNYVYVKRLLRQQEQQQQQNQNQNGDGRDQQQDQQDQQDQQQDQQDQQNQQDQSQDGSQDPAQPGNGGEGEDDGEGENGEPQPVEARISDEEQERLLDAIQAEEDKTQDKLKEKARGVVVRGRKNW